MVGTCGDANEATRPGRAVGNRLLHRAAAGLHERAPAGLRAGPRVGGPGRAGAAAGPGPAPELVALWGHRRAGSGPRRRGAQTTAARQDAAAVAPVVARE